MEKEKVIKDAQDRENSALKKKIDEIEYQLQSSHDNETELILMTGKYQEIQQEI